MTGHHGHPVPAPTPFKAPDFTPLVHAGAKLLLLALVVGGLVLYVQHLRRRAPQPVRGTALERFALVLKNGDDEWDDPWVQRGLLRRQGEAVTRPRILRTGPRFVEFSPLPGSAALWMRPDTKADLVQLCGRAVRVTQTGKGIAVQV